MSERRSPEELLTFPCLYEYKVFGAADDHGFCPAVVEAVSRFAAVSGDAVRTRLSSGGRYQCVTIRVPLDTGSQLSQIYAALRVLDGVRYLL